MVCCACKLYAGQVYERCQMNCVDYESILAVVIAKTDTLLYVCVFKLVNIRISKYPF